jgi:hypothetical protein
VAGETRLGEIAIKLFDTQAEAIDYAKKMAESKGQHPRPFDEGDDAESLNSL